MLEKKPNMTNCANMSLYELGKKLKNGIRKNNGDKRWGGEITKEYVKERKSMKL